MVCGVWYPVYCYVCFVVSGVVCCEIFNVNLNYRKKLYWIIAKFLSSIALKQQRNRFVAPGREPARRV